MKRIASGLVAGFFVLAASGCSTTAPAYPVSIENVELLKMAGDFKARVGTFGAAQVAANANPISLRGTAMRSPYGNSYGDYVAEAIKQELMLAQKLAPAAGVEISGEMLKNDIDAAIGTGRGNAQVRFVVKQGGQVRFDKVKSTEQQWESSFAGMVALPRAMQEYGLMIQKLLASLYSDPDFVKAVK